MNRPPLHVRVLGSPVVVLPMAGFCLFSLYLFTLDGRAWPMCLAFGFVMAKVIKANEQAAAFSRWRATWDSMSPHAAPKRSFKKFCGAVIGIAGGVGLVVIGDTEGAPAAIAAVILIGGALAFFATLAKLWGWSRRRRPAVKAIPVTICVTKPLMAIPDMRSAYRGLPEHCLRMLRTTR